MGWFSVRVIPHRQHDIEPEHESEHVEYIEPAPTGHFPIQDSPIPDEDLPFISAACVHQQRMTHDSRRKHYWIVVDNMSTTARTILTSTPEEVQSSEVLWGRLFLAILVFSFGSHYEDLGTEATGWENKGGEYSVQRAPTLCRRVLRSLTDDSG
ncbi:hypothetical protein ASPFODRAFT_401961 [Aspergillus luchuensis CBS 106.47]|uniref:Uncharacterized protein n=1 Tax=Aspergillus luchuensis (strain CBS 106.47) TaxID=1137211 RepID=A0A1M3T1G8_ASPLC|nr:hypothetical protein ASPFODRAFT_401961 [Aspergillus luchuensis CBS 106.47]